MLGYEDDFFSASELAVKGVGITNPWPRKSFKGVLYNLYRVVIFSVATVYFVFELMVMKETIKDLFKFLGNIGMFATHFVGVSKFLILTTQRKKIQKIMDSLQSDKFKYVSLGNFKPYEKFNTAKKRSSKIVTVLMVCYVGVGVSAHISAVLNMLGHEYTENIDCQMFVPYFSYWPYDFNTTFKCHILFFLFDWPLGIFASNIAGYVSLL
ncbi:unnamed protein product [Brassicogethes aeneus]|uniref:Uncharacterized protein n=1 Tax=Brassicogethes aeneus TaxID=1431903 RepID=A0A9P0BEL3_BRAAE|nr:unnamed protein product [Brassicogethes aeneus]